MKNLLLYHCKSSNHIYDPAAGLQDHFLINKNQSIHYEPILDKADY